jgi:hypothetical protein
LAGDEAAEHVGADNGALDVGDFVEGVGEGLLGFAVKKS